MAYMIHDRWNGQKLNNLFVYFLSANYLCFMNRTKNVKLMNLDIELLDNISII
jgi:hypothetical protein